MLQLFLTRFKGFRHDIECALWHQVGVDLDVEDVTCAAVAAHFITSRHLVNLFQGCYRYLGVFTFVVDSDAVQDTFAVISVRAVEVLLMVVYQGT